MVPFWDFLIKASVIINIKVSADNLTSVFKLFFLFGLSTAVQEDVI